MVEASLIGADCEWAVFFKQYYLGCLAQASYLIGDTETGRAVVVDPRRDIDEYLADATQEGLTIELAILTHFHADFLAGHIELRDRVGAAIGLGPTAEPEYAFQPLADGESIDLGAVALRILHTPGHTPESICVVVTDSSSGVTEPYAVLTGDTLFIGDVGRPDLPASMGVEPSEMASHLYDSLHQKLMTLPDATLLYPGHGAGSLCGRALGSETISTVGEQREYNYAVQPMERSAFVELIGTDQPAAPAYFAYDVDLNKREHGSLDDSLDRELVALSVDGVLTREAEGAQLLDVREAGSFAAVHLRGTMNVGLDGQFSLWSGSLLRPDRPIVLVAEPGSEREAAMRLGRIGFDNITGYLEGGMAALHDRDDLLEHFTRYSPARLAEVLAEPAPPTLLDVRSDPERIEGEIAGNVHIPLLELESRLDELPREGGIVAYCAGGYRSAMAMGLLARNGFAGVSDLAGGFNAWAQTVAV